MQFDERPLGGKPDVMNVTGQSALSGATLARQQHRRVRACDVAGGFEELVHHGAVCNEPMRLGRLRVLVAGRTARRLDRLVDRGAQPLELDRFGEQVTRASVHRGDGPVYTCEAGRNDDGQVRVACPQLPDERHPIHAWHLQVGDHCFGMAAADPAQGCRAARRFDRLVTNLPQIVHQATSKDRVVVDDKHGWLRQFVCSANTHPGVHSTHRASRSGSTYHGEIA